MVVDFAFLWRTSQRQKPSVGALSSILGRCSTPDQESRIQVCTVAILKRPYGVNKQRSKQRSKLMRRNCKILAKRNKLFHLFSIHFSICDGGESNRQFIKIHFDNCSPVRLHFHAYNMLTEDSMVLMMDAKVLKHCYFSLDAGIIPVL